MVIYLMEDCFELFVLTSLEDTDNRDRLVAVRLVLEVLLGNGESTLAFLSRGGRSNPDKDSVDCISNEDISSGEVFACEGDLLNLEGTRGIRDLEETLLLFEVGVITSVLGGLDGLLATEGIPEELGVNVALLVVILSEGILVNLASTLVIEGLEERSSLGDLTSSGSSRLEAVKVKSTIIDEHITKVKRIGGGRYLTNNGLVQFSLDVKESRNELLRFNVLEARFNTSSQDFKLGEERKEFLAFLALNFTVLDWETIQVIVEFDGLVCSGTCFVLGGGLSEPEVNIVEKLILLLVGVEDDVTITRVELSILSLRPGDNLELLHTPDVNTNALSSCLPSRLTFSGVLLDFLLKRGAEEGHVGVGDVDLFLLKHGCG
jgi:hypothetical protein